MTSDHATDIILSFGTLRRASFPDRVEAAASAGVRGIGLTVYEYLALLESGWTDRQLGALLARFDVTIDEAELIVGFWAEPGPAGVPARPGMVYADPKAEQALCRLADEHGTRSMQAVGTFDGRPIGPEVPEAFAALCDRVAPHGLDVALEFVTYTSIPNLAVAQAIVAEAGRPNGGLCIDSWHFFRGGGTVADLEGVDAAHVFMVQINDGVATPVDADPMVEAVRNRYCPGEGEFPLEEFVTALLRAGVAVPMSVEVFSHELERIPSREAAERAASATRALLRRCEPSDSGS